MVNVLDLRVFSWTEGVPPRQNEFLIEILFLTWFKTFSV